MAKKTGLGKGLDSLIPVHNNTEKEMAVVEKVVEKKTDTVLRITEIEPNKGQPRKNFNEDALEELADSIKQFGVLDGASGGLRPHAGLEFPAGNSH